MRHPIAVMFIPESKIQEIANTTLLRLLSAEEVDKVAAHLTTALEEKIVDMDILVEEAVQIVFAAEIIGPTAESEDPALRDAEEAS